MLNENDHVSCSLCHLIKWQLTPLLFILTSSYSKSSTPSLLDLEILYPDGWSSQVIVHFFILSIFSSTQPNVNMSQPTSISFWLELSHQHVEHVSCVSCNLNHSRRKEDFRSFWVLCVMIIQSLTIHFICLFIIGVAAYWCETNGEGLYIECLVCQMWWIHPCVNIFLSSLARLDFDIYSHFCVLQCPISVFEPLNITIPVTKSNTNSATISD